MFKVFITLDYEEVGGEGALYKGIFVDIFEPWHVISNTIAFDMCRLR